MKFDEQGHVVWSPQELYQVARSNVMRLVDGYLMTGTPWAFKEYDSYCDFLAAG